MYSYTFSYLNSLQKTSVHYQYGYLMRVLAVMRKSIQLAYGLLCKYALASTYKFLICLQINAHCFSYWIDLVVYYRLKEALDGIEFARGPLTSKWGKIRASLGHPEPFDLRYVAIGNEDCGMYNYLGNYLKFYDAIKHHYPDIKIISNCDATASPLDHPADIFDFHVYTSSRDIFSMYNKFDSLNRTGPKAFVSEYAVWQQDAGFGTLLSALGEAAFLMGLEKDRCGPWFS